MEVMQPTLHAAAPSTEARARHLRRLEAESIYILREVAAELSEKLAEDRRANENGD